LTVAIIKLEAFCVTERLSLQCPGTLEATREESSE